jgi:hypothetical protein
MTQRTFRDFCIAHQRSIVVGDQPSLFSPGEQFAFDLYRVVRDRKNSPIQTILSTIVNPLQLQNAIDIVRCRLDALEISGTCDPEFLQEWRNVESTLVVIFELLAGTPEDTS